jgi:hypothetical protein
MIQLRSDAGFEPCAAVSTVMWVRARDRIERQVGDCSATFRAAENAPGCPSVGSTRHPADSPPGEHLATSHVALLEGAARAQVARVSQFRIMAVAASKAAPATAKATTSMRTCSNRSPSGT